MCPSGRLARVPRPRAGPPALLLALALLAGACGSEDDPAAFPAPSGAVPSPPTSTRPAGRVVRVGGQAHAVAADPASGRVAVAVSGPDELVVLDGVDLRVRRRVALPGRAEHVALAGPGGPVLAAAAGAVVAVPLSHGAPRAWRAGGALHDLVAAPGGAVAGDRRGAALAVLRDGGVVARGPAGPAPDGVAALDDGRVAVVGARARVLALHDERTGRRLEERPAGVGPTHVEAGDGGRLYVADTAAGAVLLFRSRPELALVRRTALAGGPFATAIDRERGKLWVTLTATNEVAQLTADGQPRPQRRFATVRAPSSVAVDDRTGRVFVTGRTGGTLQVFDGYPDR